MSAVDLRRTRWGEDLCAASVNWCAWLFLDYGPTGVGAAGGRSTCRAPGYCLGEGSERGMKSRAAECMVQYILEVLFVSC